MIQSYTEWRLITPSDTIDLPKLTRALYVGVAGDVAAVMQNGDMPGALPLTQGWHPLTCRRVNASLTTATKIYAFYQV